MGSEVIHVIKVGKVEGNKLRLGKQILVPVDPENPGGPKKTAIEFGRVSLKLGNGLTVVGENNGLVALEVTAEAAARLDWPHPANEPKKPVADVGQLRRIVASDAYGQSERRTALQQIREVDASLAQALATTFSWLEAA